jgi:hypothetical protein
MFVDFQCTRWLYIADDKTLYTHHCDGLKSYIVATCFSKISFLGVKRVFGVPELSTVNYDTIAIGIANEEI